MSDPNAVSWSEHRSFHATFDGLTLTVMQPIFGSGAQFFWEVSGFGQSNKGTAPPCSRPSATARPRLGRWRRAW